MLARSEEGFQGAVGQIAVASVVVLLAAIVFGWSPLVPLALALVGGTYGAELAVDDEALDGAAPLVAAGLVVAAELAYWSLEERERVPGEPREGLRRVPFVAVLGLGSLVVGAVLLALVDEIRVRGLALDVAGAFAAAAALTVILLLARGRTRAGG